MRIAYPAPERGQANAGTMSGVSDEQAQALKLLADGLLERMRADPELAARLRGKMASE